QRRRVLAVRLVTHARFFELVGIARRWRRRWWDDHGRAAARAGGVLDDVIATARGGGRRLALDAAHRIGRALATLGDCFLREAIVLVALVTAPERERAGAILVGDLALEVRQLRLRGLAIDRVVVDLFERGSGRGPVVRFFCGVEIAVGELVAELGLRFGLERLRRGR